MRSLLILTTLVAAACGSSDDSTSGDGDGDGDGDTTGDCNAVNTQMCELACGCSAGPECTIVFSGGATATSDNLEECVGFWATFGCAQDGSETVDYPACSEALDTAQCSTIGDKIGITLPEICNAE